MSRVPIVSIIVPTHNRPELLSRAVSSLLNQSYKEIEIIVIDDGSSCDVSRVLSRFDDERIKFHRNSTPLGACYARNIGISLSQGKFITFLDDDDEFLPSRIECLVDRWDPVWSFLGTGRYRINKFGQKKKGLPGPEITLDDILFKITIGNSVFTLT